MQVLSLSPLRRAVTVVFSPPTKCINHLKRNQIRNLTTVMLLLLCIVYIGSYTFIQIFFHALLNCVRIERDFSNTENHNTARFDYALFGNARQRRRIPKKNAATGHDAQIVRARGEGVADTAISPMASAPRSTHQPRFTIHRLGARVPSGAYPYTAGFLIFVVRRASRRRHRN